MSALALAFENDGEIISEYCNTHSDRAATAFVRKHQKFVFATALRNLEDYDYAEDAAQEVFIKALENLHKFRGDSNIKTWLYRITTNVCTNYRRKKKLMSFLYIGSDEKYQDIPAFDQTPDKKYESKEFEKNFLDLLTKLPKKQREIFSLRYFDDMPYDDIAKMLGKSLGGVKSNYFQAVQKLAKFLKYEK